MLYGFKYDVKSPAPSNIILQISHITNGDRLLNPNVYSILDVEMRVCVPEITILTNLYDEVCYDDEYTMTGQYIGTGLVRAK